MQKHPRASLSCENDKKGSYHSIGHLQTFSGYLHLASNADIIFSVPIEVKSGNFFLFGIMADIFDCYTVCVFFFLFEML